MLFLPKRDTSCSHVCFCACQRYRTQKALRLRVPALTQSIIRKHLINICVNVCLCTWQAAAGNIINMLWQLMENGLEELKLLQTVLVLLTTNTVVHDEVLSKVWGKYITVQLLYNCYILPTCTECRIILQRFVPVKAIVLCFRLHFTKDNITNNTAAATVRQVVTVVFERMVAEDERFKGQMGLRGRCSVWLNRRKIHSKKC